MANESDILIQEPSDLPPSAVADDDALIVYSQDPVLGGVKKLALSSLKGVLNFNADKVDNLKECIGINVDLDDPNFTPISPTIQGQLDAVFDQTGVSREPSQPTPADQTLVARMGSAEANILTLYSQIGGEPSGGGSITSKLDALDETVNGNGSTIPGLANQVPVLITTVGDQNSGLVKNVSDLNTTVNGDGTPSTGLVNKVNTLDTTVNGDGTSTGIVGEIDTINRTINGDGTSTGIVGEISALQTTTTNLDSRINNLAARLKSFNPTPETGAINLSTQTESGVIYRIVAKRLSSLDPEWFDGVFDRSGTDSVLTPLNNSQVEDFFNITTYTSKQEVMFISIERISV